MVLINRLKNGAGKNSDFDLYLPQGVDILVKSPEFTLSDDDIPDKIRQGNLKLLYRPNICTIRRDKTSGKIVLTDIATHQISLPHDLASFMPEKACPEIVFHGYMLCIDKNLTNLTPEEKNEIQKITAHFEKLKNNDMNKSAKHELRHIENSVNFNEIHENNQALNHNFYIRKCFLDEISATVQEDIDNNAHTKEEALIFAKRTFSEWMSNPNRKTYYEPKGDFEHQWGIYEDKTLGKNTSQSEQMYQKICKKFFTFKVNGKEMDLTAAINPNFDLPNKKTSQATFIQYNAVGGR